MSVKHDENHPSGEWQLQEAKNQLSSVVRMAAKEGPQTITSRGEPTAVLISFEDYKKLTKSRKSLSVFFAESPLHDVDLDLSRSQDLPREVDL